MHSKEMEEFRKKVIEAKIRLVLGLKPDDDISKAGRVVTPEEQKEELENLRREVDQLKKILSKMRRSNSGHIPQEERKTEDCLEKEQYR